MDEPKRRWTWDELTTAALDEDGEIHHVPMRRLRHKVGEFPWDEWTTRATAAGVPKELAQLGRAVIREAYQHSWSAALQTECGWDDDGDAMIELALRDPTQANRRWSLLMDSDGHADDGCADN
jgi:hypothetical protein